MEIFVDTSAFVALTNRSDQYHSKAREFLKTITFGWRFHTSNYIIDETITRIRLIVSHRAALNFGRSIFSSRIYQIYYIDDILEKEAFKIFEKYSDKRFSFTDCTSFALMRKLRIKDAFAFDDDFITLGFNLLPS